MSEPLQADQPRLATRTADAPSLYRGLSRAALDAEYNARATVPDIAPFLRAYAERSAHARANLPCTTHVAYGDHADETLDIFPASSRSPGPVFIYLHGGYWRLLSKDDSSFMAPGLTAAGVTVVAVNYSLAPAVTLDRIVDQCRRAIAWTCRHAAAHHGNPAAIIVAGSSAGGHLAAMALMDGWHTRYGVDPNAIQGAVLLSGIFDLTPLVHTDINEWMRMTEQDAQRNSPMLHLPARGPEIIVSHGGNETSEFKRQTKDFLAAWQARGMQGQYVDMPLTNHFDLPLTLDDSRSPLGHAVTALAHRLQEQSAGKG